MYSLYIFGGLALVVLLIYLALSVYGLALTYHLFLQLRAPAQSGSLAISGGERVCFRSRDGVQLEGVLLKSRSLSRRVIIFCHEAGADMGSFKNYGWFLPDHGFNVLTFNFRDQRRDGYGRRVRPWVTSAELDDLIGAINYVRSRFNIRAQEVGLLGVSRGASAALCAAANRELVGAVVADGSFDTRETVETYMRKWTSYYLPARRLPSIIYHVQSYLTVKLAELRLRCRFPSVKRAIVSQGNIGLFLIHGGDDRYIPYKQALDLRALSTGRAERTRIWIAPQADHNCSARLYSDEYSRRVSEFFDQCLEGA